jgi:hypothetical protein
VGSSVGSTIRGTNYKVHKGQQPVVMQDNYILLTSTPQSWELDLHVGVYKNRSHLKEEKR